MPEGGAWGGACRKGAWFSVRPKYDRIGKGKFLTTDEKAPVIDGWLFDVSVDERAQVKQGDLLRFFSPNSELHRIAIVVTADCDLTNRKHAGLLTLVPLISSQAALENYLLPEDLQKKEHLVENYALKKFASDGGEGREAKLDVLRAMPPDEFAQLSPSDQAVLQSLKRSATSISIEVYRDILNAIGSKVPQWTTFREKMRTKGDLLLLPSLERIGIAESIAWVRPVWQAPLADIALRTSEMATKKAERIARLDSPFRYRLTQLLGQVFSDVGLPDTASQIDQEIEGLFDE